jgi:hypothetical protein
VARPLEWFAARLARRFSCVDSNETQIFRELLVLIGAILIAAAILGKGHAADYRYAPPPPPRQAYAVPPIIVTAPQPTAPLLFCHLHSLVELWLPSYRSRLRSSSHPCRYRGLGRHRCNQLSSHIRHRRHTRPKRTGRRVIHHILRETWKMDCSTELSARLAF